jgi:hypothetical protein
MNRHENIISGAIPRISMRGSDFANCFPGRWQAPFLRSGVAEFHGIRMSFKGEHPIEVALSEMLARMVPEECLGWKE